MRWTVRLLGDLNTPDARNRFGAYKRDGKDIFKRVVLKAKLGEGIYNKLLRFFDREFFDIEVNEGVVVGVYETEEIPNVVVDTYSLIKKLVEQAGGSITKRELYEKYTQEAKCSRRTAEIHLRKALECGVVEENGYYAVRLPKTKENEENEENLCN